MKKSVIMLIAVIYIASIVVISLFGMKMSVYNEIIPVTSIECTNVDDATRNITINDTNPEKKVIKIKFTQPADKNTLTGTMVQLSWRVYPDNATTKHVKFVYDTNNNSRFEFVKDGNDRENGLVLFYGKIILDVKIMSTDGRKITAQIRLTVY